MSNTAVPSRFRQLIEPYLDKRIVFIFIFGIASGFPWVLIGKAMTVWLQDAGLTRTGIGYFGSIFTVYAFNFAWAPLVDRVRLPLLGWLGQRRSWILLCHIIILLAMIGISFTDPSASLLWASLLALLIAIASATQDVAIDAFRIDTIGREEKPKIAAAAAAATSGWWAGFGAIGGVALIAADHTSWANVYLVLSVVVLAGIVGVLVAREPVSDRTARQAQDEQDLKRWIAGESFVGRAGRWLTVTFLQPIIEFFTRNGLKLAISVLGFILLFKVGEAFLGRMAIVFYKEVGFSNTEIGLYSSFSGAFFTIAFTLLGSAFSIRYGLLRGLMLGGIAMASTNLIFAALALTGPVVPLFLLAVIVDNFTSACATVAFVAFISYLTSQAYTATQYALMASIGNFGRTSLAIFSGAMVDGLDGNWSLFFIITALMVIPGLLLLQAIGRQLRSNHAGSDSPL